ncbi:MAG: hypothetical protein KJO69_08015 [Gammaproteobacteria bacterium]|nr:hypothetical protein [Gammaproteobacteria bacterium]
MAKLKVFGGMGHMGGEQMRFIVGAYSQKKAVERLQEAGVDVTMHYFKSYWSETSNSVEVSLAHREPEVVFVKPKYHSQEYYRASSNDLVELPEEAYSELTNDCWNEIRQMSLDGDVDKIKACIEKYLQKSSAQSMEDNCTYTL